MKVLAICGSYRKHKTIDTLIDKAIEGIKSVNPDLEIEKVYLIDKKIEYCRGCMFCFHVDPKKEVGECVIKDDMQELSQKLNQANGYIFATPIFDGTVTAIMKTFIERFSFCLSKPGNHPIKGCPTPRTKLKKFAIILLSSALIPPVFRMFCDDATKLFKECLPCMLNSKIVGSLYAGSVGIKNTNCDRYLNKAFSLGKKLAVKLDR